jgi:hypothetical protein
MCWHVNTVLQPVVVELLGPTVCSLTCTVSVTCTLYAAAAAAAAAAGGAAWPCRYEAMIFSLACEGLHPEDAYQVESLLAFMIQVGGGKRERKIITDFWLCVS